MKRKCSACGSPVIKLDQNEFSSHLSGVPLPTFNIGQKSSEVRPIIKIFEPVLVNPNSYKNVETVLKEIKSKAISGDRKWVFLGCDGPPYCLSERIAERNPDFYDFVHFVPGLGHMHMNQLKTIFRILDEILLEPLGADVLNFNSKKAYDFFVNAKDTHKSWQTLQVLLIGSTMELIHQYLNDTLEADTNVLGFLQWQAQQENESIKLVSQLILNYVLAVYFFKIGVRNNDVNLIDAARFKFDDLFYAFNHPIYREINRQI